MDLDALDLLNTSKTWKGKDQNSIMEHKVETLSKYYLESWFKSQKYTSGMNTYIPHLYFHAYAFKYTPISHK